MNSFPLRLESILVFLINQMQDTRRKIGSKMHGKKLIIDNKVSPCYDYFNFYFMIMITDITDMFQFPKFTPG